VSLTLIITQQWFILYWVSSRHVYFILGQLASRIFYIGSARVTYILYFLCTSSY